MARYSRRDVRGFGGAVAPIGVEANLGRGLGGAYVIEREGVGRLRSRRGIARSVGRDRRQERFGGERWDESHIHDGLGWRCGFNERETSATSRCARLGIATGNWGRSGESRSPVSLLGYRQGLLALTFGDRDDPRVRARAIMMGADHDTPPVE
jgi:hypothetical protein